MGNFQGKSKFLCFFRFFQNISVVFRAFSISNKLPLYRNNCIHLGSKHSQTNKEISAQSDNRQFAFIYIRYRLSHRPPLIIISVIGPHLYHQTSKQNLQLKKLIAHVLSENLYKLENLSKVQ